MLALQFKTDLAVNSFMSLVTDVMESTMEFSGLQPDTGNKHSWLPGYALTCTWYMVNSSFRMTAAAQQPTRTPGRSLELSNCSCSLESGTTSCSCIWPFLPELHPMHPTRI